MGAAWVFVLGSDLMLTKSGPANAVVGGQISYALTVTNNGPSDMTNVVVSDPLPAGTTLPSSTPSQGTCNAVVICTLGNLAIGSSATITIVVKATTVGTVTNTASVAATEFDRDLSNNSMTATTNVSGVCDRAVTKTVTPSSVQSGGTVSVALTVKNVGTAPCAPVAGKNVADAAPAGLTFVPPVTGAPSGWTCGLTPAVVSCSATSPLPVSGVVTITFTAKVTATAGSSVQNCAQIYAPDANAANDRACALIQVAAGVCDRALTKTVTPTSVPTGGTVTVTMTVKNVGTGVCAPVPGKNVADLNPGGLTFVPPVTGAPAGWTCGLTPNVVFCSATSPLPVDGAVTITFVAKVTGAPGSSIRNCAMIFAPDANAANDQACATIVVTPACVVPPANMVAWWPLDEGAGATAFRISSAETARRPSHLRSEVRRLHSRCPASSTAQSTSTSTAMG